METESDQKLLEQDARTETREQVGHRITKEF